MRGLAGIAVVLWLAIAALAQAAPAQATPGSAASPGATATPQPVDQIPKSERLRTDHTQLAGPLPQGTQITTTGYNAGTTPTRIAQAGNGLSNVFGPIDFQSKANQPVTYGSTDTEPSYGFTPEQLQERQRQQQINGPATGTPGAGHYDNNGNWILDGPRLPNMPPHPDEYDQRVRRHNEATRLFPDNYGGRQALYEAQLRSEDARAYQQALNNQYRKTPPQREVAQPGSASHACMRYPNLC